MTASRPTPSTDTRTYGLTDKGAELLAFLRQCADDGVSPPTYQEIADNLGLASKSGVHRLVGQLEERGLIRRLRQRQQSIALVEPATISLPDDVDGMLRAAAQDAGRTPSEHMVALIRRHCPVLQPF